MYLVNPNKNLFPPPYPLNPFHAGISICDDEKNGLFQQSISRTRDQGSGDKILIIHSNSLSDNGQLTQQDVDPAPTSPTTPTFQPIFPPSVMISVFERCRASGRCLCCSVPPLWEYVFGEEQCFLFGKELFGIFVEFDVPLVEIAYLLSYWIVLVERRMGIF